MFTTLIFDLDDTLYPPSSGVWDMISERIHLFMIERVGISPESVEQTRKNYYTKYGTTMRGLVMHYQINPAEYLAFVHEIPATERILPDPRLRSFIQNLPFQKFIFTNSDRLHTMRILKHLDLSDLFLDVIDIMDIFPSCKPMPEAFQIAARKISRQPNECIFIDDSVKNLDEAFLQGFYTILPNAAKTEKSMPHSRVKTLLDLEKVLP